jgi:hypothetical protein
MSSSDLLGVGRRAQFVQYFRLKDKGDPGRDRNYRSETLSCRHQLLLAGHSPSKPAGDDLDVDPGIRRF